MKKILLLSFVLTALIMVACATVTWKGSTTVQVTDKAGNKYSCDLNYKADAQAGICAFYIQKGPVVFKCELTVAQQAKAFSIEEDCTIEIVLEPAEPKEDQACHFPKNSTNAFFNRTI